MLEQIAMHYLKQVKLLISLIAIAKVLQYCNHKFCVLQINGYDRNAEVIAETNIPVLVLCNSNHNALIEANQSYDLIS